MIETWPCRFCERPLSEHDTDNGDSPEAQVCAALGSMPISNTQRKVWRNWWREVHGD